MALPSSGVEYASLFEWCKAAKFCSPKQLREFFEEDVFWQNLSVAFYRADSRLEAVVSHREARRARSKQSSANRPITG
jgi:hypothetical protein